MNGLKIAVIGAGHLGRIHTRLLKSIPNVHVVGVVDPVDTARDSVAAEFEIGSYPDYHPLIEKIDAAVVAAPTNAHYPIVRDLLESGKHVLVEKPFTEHSGESQELVKLAADRHLVLQVGHVERFNPAWEAVASSIDAPKYIESARTSGYTFRSTDIGVVLDLMIHDIDLILSVVQDEVIDVQALGISVFGGHEDVAQARLTFANGCVANLTASRCSFTMQRNMQLFSEGGYAAVDFNAGTTKVVSPIETLQQRKIDFAELTTDQQQFVRETLFENYLPIREVQVEPKNAIQEELLDFVDCIANSGTPRVTGRDGSNAVVVAEKVLYGIEHHCWTADAHGPCGPMAIPGRHIISTPHWTTENQPVKHRRAG